MRTSCREALRATAAALALLCLLIGAPSAMVNANTPDPVRFWESRGLPLHVSPDGAYVGPCGNSGEPPCALHRAMTNYTPNQRIVFQPGTYRGCFRVTIPVVMVADAQQNEPFSATKKKKKKIGDVSDVIWDGEGQCRQLWFDNVRAHIVGISFINGYGENAGCVLVSRAQDEPRVGNVFHDLTFLNCTGYRDPTSPFGFAAGALAVVYQRAIGRMSMWDGVKIYENSAIGRADGLTAGGAIVRYGRPRHSNSSGSYGSSSTDVSTKVSVGIRTELLSLPLHGAAGESRSGYDNFQPASERECHRYGIIRSTLKIYSAFQRHPKLRLGDQAAYYTDCGDEQRYWLMYCTQTLTWAMAISPCMPVDRIGGFDPCNKVHGMGVHSNGAFPGIKPEHVLEWRFSAPES